MSISTVGGPKAKQKNGTATSHKPAAPPTTNKSSYEAGTNYVAGGLEADPYFFAIIVAAPFLSLLLAYLTSPEMALEYPGMAKQPLTGMLYNVFSQSPAQTLAAVWKAGVSVAWPNLAAAKLIGSFFAVALVLERLLPGKVQTGPTTLTGHTPKYVDNGVKHCVVFTLLFWAGSNLGYGDWYDFGILYDEFTGSVAFLNVFGIVFCIFLTFKGLYFPSTDDCGSSGSWIKDYLWGTELYPRIGGLDLKRFINCRFSMTYWQLAGLSFCYRSYTLHGTLDYGLAFSAASQFLYLCKFFWWEMGYMRSIDIIVDRAGFEIQWGCLVWVPAVYTFHSRFGVQHPTGLSLPVASLLLAVSLMGVVLNYLADRQRDVFRAADGKIKVWGKEPKYIVAKYTVLDRQTGQTTTKTSLLLASGYWGVARHFQYLWELTAAWSWCLLANPAVNGVLPLFYAAFLTWLLTDRANRDSKKCHLKYGKYYEEYCQLVPYKILPGVY